MFFLIYPYPAKISDSQIIFQIKKEVKPVQYYCRKLTLLFPSTQKAIKFMTD